jgi:hypothetical protein
MGIPPFYDSMIIHALGGIGVVVFFAMRAMGRNNTPPRWVGDFGTGVWGQKIKWIQWYSWAMTWEFITSLFYIHTGLFYYEIGMSFIEGVAMTVGAWFADRVVDFFLGISDSVPPSESAETIKAHVQAAGEHVSAFTSRVRQTMKPKPSTVDEDTLKKENQAFDDITRGH